MDIYFLERFLFTSAAAGGSYQCRDPWCEFLGSQESAWVGSRHSNSRVAWRHARGHELPGRHFPSRAQSSTDGCSSVSCSPIVKGRISSSPHFSKDSWNFVGSGRGPRGYNPYFIWAYAFCLLLAPLKLKTSGCCNQLTCMAGVTKVPVLALPSGFSSFFFLNLGDFLKFSQVQLCI